jgi:hypothetical protein
MINIKETNQRIAEYLMGQRTSVTIAIESIEPTVEYASSFSPTSEGIGLFMKYFVQTHDGTYGVQLAELGGQQRTASYNPNRQFDIAGAGRILIGYGMLRGMENNLTVSDFGGDSNCLNEVLRSYDTYCVNAAVFSSLKRDQEALGLGNSLIYGDGIKSSASDMAGFLRKVYSGEISLTEAHRTQLLDGLKTAEPRAGIGTIGSQIIDATGSYEGQRSDVALVKAGSSEYALAIMTSGSSWVDMADLARQLHEFMNR